ncbi:MAG: DoxX-like family protein [Verrucomicrobiota bacterium]
MNPDKHTIHRILTIARVGLGLVWFYQGIVPKLFFPMEFELDIIERSQMYLYSPHVMIFLVGIGETAISLWLLSGYRERLACLFATAFMLFLQVIVVFIEPSLLIGPFGGIAKNMGLIALAWIVWKFGTEHARDLNETYHGLFREIWQALRERRCAIRATAQYLNRQPGQT